MANARGQTTVEASCMWLACSERMEKEKGTQETSTRSRGFYVRRECAAKSSEYKIRSPANIIFVGHAYHINDLVICGHPRLWYRAKS
jgi:hypothetical protein